MRGGREDRMSDMYSASSPNKYETASAGVQQDKQLRDEIVRRLMTVGCACAADLANELKTEATEEKLQEVLESLVEEGILRHMRDPKDDRKYEGNYTVYEI